MPTAAARAADDGGARAAGPCAGGAGRGRQDRRGRRRRHAAGPGCDRRRACRCALSAQQAVDALEADLQRIVAAADETLRLAGVARERVDALYFTGGSTGLAPLAQRIAARLPGAAVVQRRPLRQRRPGPGRACAAGVQTDLRCCGSDSTPGSGRPASPVQSALSPRRAGSPRPTRTSTGSSPVRSITVVGCIGQAPASTMACKRLLEALADLRAGR